MAESSKQAEKPQPVSQWTDAKLRPWTIDEKLDGKIADANVQLDDMMQKTSGSRNAGCRGSNLALDSKPDAFVDFEKMIADPNWMAKLGTEEGDAEAERILAELEQMIKEKEMIEQQQNDMAIAGKVDEDKALMNSIMEFNASLYETNGVQPDTETGAYANSERRGLDPSENPLERPTSATLKLIEKVRLSRKPRKKKVNPLYSLKSIPYKPKPGPSVLNVSTVEFGKLMERFNLAKAQRAARMGGELTIGPDGKSTFIPTPVIANQNTTNFNATAETMLVSTDSKLSSAPLSLATGSAEGDVSDLEALDKNELIELLMKERASSKQGSRPTSEGLNSPKPLPTIGENVQEPETSSKPNSASLLASIQIATSPIKSSRPSSSTLNMTSASMDLGSISNAATSGPRSVRKMSKSLSVPSLGGSDSRGKNAAKSSALDKLSLSGAMNNTHSLSKKRIKEIRALRDHLMTTGGSMTINVNPESSPDAQEEVAESIAVTKEMVAETLRKNRVDQTWTLISTPGFYEAVGPEEIFKSDIHKNYVRTDAFDKATRNADVSKGIKRDPLRVWSEDGVKNKIKIFQSGGALKI